MAFLTKLLRSLLVTANNPNLCFRQKVLIFGIKFKSCLFFEFFILTCLFISKFQFKSILIDKLFIKTVSFVRRLNIGWPIHTLKKNWIQKLFLTHLINCFFKQKALIGLRAIQKWPDPKIRSETKSKPTRKCVPFLCLSN